MFIFSRSFSSKTVDGSWVGSIDGSWAGSIDGSWAGSIDGSWAGSLDSSLIGSICCGGSILGANRLVIAEKSKIFFEFDCGIFGLFSTDCCVEGS